MHYKRRHASLLVFLLFLAFSVNTASAVDIEVNDEVGVYFPGQIITGQIDIIYNEYFERDSMLDVCIEDDCKSISLYNYLFDASDYEYDPQNVRYYLTSDGINNWPEHPDQDFDYNISASGTCGQCGTGTCGGENCGENCDCFPTCLSTGGITPCCEPLAGYGEGSDPYPCVWSDWGEYIDYTVDSSEGLKFIKESPIGSPDHHNNDTVWYVDIIINDENVTGTMRAACGGETYASFSVSDNGWVKRSPNTPAGVGTLLCTKEECNTGYCSGKECASNWDDYGARRWTCIENFDNDSLMKIGGRPPQFYGGPTYDVFEMETTDGYFGGGIYRKKPGDPEWQYLNYDTDVIWNASHYSPNPVYNCGGLGYIEIKNYYDDAWYKIVYMPPNGNRTCVYTDITEPASQSWTNYNGNLEKGCDDCITYMNPYETTYNITDGDLNYLLKSCPGGVDLSECEKEATDYGGYVTDSSCSIETLYYSNENEELYVEIETTIKTLLKENQTSVDFSKFYNLKAPGQGQYDMIINITNGSGGIVSNTIYLLKVGYDIDEDGFTVEQGDCNDDPNECGADCYPGATEICDGYDNDCDNEVDEDFSDENRTFGEPCYDWPKSACTGVWVCKPNGLDLMCSSGLEPGDQEELCLNDIDDDCDGVVDEETELVDDEEVFACTFKCTSGETKTCGSNVGICIQGYMVCVNSQWSECIDSIGPQEEVCNRKDDDCDGTVDNVDGKDSIETTQCACYDGGLPSLRETCNDIDDNCNDDIDEGIRCCEDSQERQCGTSFGICTYGMQTCENGRWGTCESTVSPQDEICYDEIDNDCDGNVDELCDLDITCHNNIQDLNEMGVDCGGDCPKHCEDYTPWIIFSVVIIIIIMSAGILEYTGKI